MSKILYVVGSLRKDSFNKKLAEKLCEVSGGEVFTLNDMPFMNEDIEKNPPKIVSDLREKILDAERIVFVTPEYNYTTSGVLKNAIDWMSRPYDGKKSVLINKDAYVIGASPSFVATARAQKDLKGILSLLSMNVINKELYVVIDYSSGKWDDKTNERIVKFAEGLK